MAPTTVLDKPTAPPRPLTVPADTDSSATRHLSAGAYLDDDFCKEALREIYYQPKRVVAPSHGFDIVTVLGHCLRARRVMVVRDLFLVALLLFACWQSLAMVVVVLVALLSVHAAAAAVVIGTDSVRYLRESGWSKEDRYDIRKRWWTGRPVQHREVPHFRWLVFEYMTAQLFARVIGVGLMYVLFAVSGALVTAALGRADLGAGRWVTVALPVLLGCIVAAFLIPVGARVWSQLHLITLLPPKSPEEGPPDRPFMNRRLAAIDKQMDGNTVIYSGHTPFVGSGYMLRRWNLAQRLVQPVPTELLGNLSQDQQQKKKREANREFPTPPFSAWDIVTHVRNQISELSDDDLPERKMPNLTVYDRIFVAGTEITSIRRHTGPEDLAEIIKNPTAPERHYLAFQVVSWRGELVTTVYVHFAVQGKSLYVELYVTGLLPCDERFRVIDEVGGTGFGAILRDAGRAVLAAPSLVASAPGNLLRACLDTLRLTSAVDLESVKLRRGYDYGAAIGIRELGASPDIPDHMQTQDIMKYGRLIERRVIASILDFLEEKGVDVTDYRQQSMTILTAGAVAMSGGKVEIKGGDAVATQTNTTGGTATDGT